MGREKMEMGRRGEDMAARFLKEKGYKILERNARTIFGELDIVTRKDNSIVFVEVKARSTSSLGPPYISVTRQKQLHLARSALFYLKKRGLIDSNWRIDVVSVKLNWLLEMESIELIENAVEEM